MIIAVVPAKGHEYLVASAPSVLPDMAFMEPERPAVLTRCEHCGRWDCVEYGHWISDRSDLPRALVLYAPGGPRLGMLRALAAIKAGINVWRDRSLRPPKDDVRAVAATHPDTTKVVVPTPPGLPDGALRAFGLAHLLVQRGIASEVIVLPLEAK